METFFNLLIVRGLLAFLLILMITVSSWHIGGRIKVRIGFDFKNRPTGCSLVADWPTLFMLALNFTAMVFVGVTLFA